MTHRFLIRPIATGDNPAMAAVIRRVMPEFGADGPGFAMRDAEVDRMYEAYAQPRCSYFVVELDGAVVGGGGVAPLEHAAPEVCELRKMYFLREARGIGAGTAMMQHPGWMQRRFCTSAPASYRSPAQWAARATSVVTGSTSSICELPARKQPGPTPRRHPHHVVDVARPIT